MNTNLIDQEGIIDIWLTIDKKGVNQEEITSRINLTRHVVNNKWYIMVRKY